MTNNPKYIVVHCSDVSNRDIFDQFNVINQSHKERFNQISILGDWVGYHRLITGDKNYKCKEDWEEGCHTNQTVDGISMNLQSLGICIGFDGDVEYPTQKQYDLAKDQILSWMALYSIPRANVKMHRFYNTAKTCPGSLITQDWIDKITTYTINLPPKPPEQTEKQQDLINTQQDSLKLQIIDLAQKVISLLKQLIGKNNK